MTIKQKKLLSPNSGGQAVYGCTRLLVLWPCEVRRGSGAKQARSLGFAFTSARLRGRGYFGGAGTPMPPRIWLQIGHDDDLRDAWWADNWDEARLNVGDLIGGMYVSWYMPNDDPTPIVEALRGAGLTVSRPLDPNKRIRVTTNNPGHWSDLESEAIDAAIERLVDLLDDEASDPREAAIQAMQSLPDELLNHLDPARFIRAMVDEHEGKVDA